MPRTLKYRIEGLDCNEEVQSLRNALDKKPGIISLEFDIINASMTVTCETDKISSESIISAVDKTGMKARPWERAPDKRNTSYLQKHSRTILTAFSAAFLITGICSHWLLHGHFLQALSLPSAQQPQHLPLPTILFYFAAIITGAWYILPKALLSAKSLHPDMNLLMIIAVIGALAIGQWFEAATVTTLFAIALLLEHWSIDRARHAVSALLELSPEVAMCVSPEDGSIIEMPVEQVPLHSTILVRPGEKIPLDGVVTKGSSSVNQAPITGESAPVTKKSGDGVYAGTINGHGAIEINVTRKAGETTIAKIIHLVRQAQARRAVTEQWVDKFAAYYTPIMLALAVAIALVPPLLFSLSFSSWLYRSLVILVISCPCALVISTPVCMVSAMTAAARNGVLVKGGIYLEAAGTLNALALDKTGTVTYGRAQVQKVIPFDEHSEQELLGIAAAIEANSNHPLAKAILTKANDTLIRPERAINFQSIKGKGAQADINGTEFWIGSHRLMHEKGQETELVHTEAEQLEDAGHSIVAIGNDRHVCGLISIADGLRNTAGKTISDIRKLGIKKIVMLTGDNRRSAEQIAKAIGLDEYNAELLPQDKVDIIQKMVKEQQKVAMVGDGINDAPAMAAATFGIAMGAIGSDLAIETADVALMSDELPKIAWLIKHSRKTLSTIKQNISFALGLKVLFITLAVLNLATLSMAIVADTGATLLVISNSLRLLKK